MFDSLSMPSVKPVFSHFTGAEHLSVLDLNSAYYQLPLSVKSRRSLRFVLGLVCMSALTNGN